MSGPIRAFIAVSLPEPIRDTLRQIQENLAAEDADVRWVRPEQIHLTLKFLGDIDLSQVPGIISHLDAGLGKMAAFSVQASGGGVFPNARKARVLWVGLEDKTDGFKTLYGATETAMAAMGFARESRAFRPHLTLGRPRRDIHPAVMDRMLAVLQTAGSDPFEVDRIFLYQSRLHPS
ncbi:RNA 2',3'-cyclic phosphodiesterase, partial [Desulfosarcina sp. OttesenSCG-928-G17]|nr:RNA 2',3'-cyclic phosphodiesterase [Desulfosarcina sp. OttesenSCG-928-G17]